ncbi:sn-glycerol-1-phosphate dehydrogenase [Neobacillus mesonae]|nr:sn-glycerol-1-phosphate dehydrogenase [Neobacillus mesonae]
MNMNDQIARWNEEAADCTCGNPHRTVKMHICLEEGALSQIAPYVSSQNYNQVTIVFDEYTKQAAGDQVIAHLGAAGITAHELFLPRNAGGEVVADEAFIVKVLLGVSRDCDAVIAVGSGTIHDLVRFVCFKMGKPFISVPTAASVDGFTSAGAPLIVDGTKQTFQAIPPEAIFADLSVLEKSPQVMTAAGFGDMLGKFTSLADWKISRDLGGEPYCPLAYRMTEEALMDCVHHVDEISEGSKAGVKILLEALIASGISMLIIDHSRPASGGEHHISHRLEMEFLEQGKPAILHGAKVGVASALLTNIYRDLYKSGQEAAFEAYKDLPEQKQMQDWLSRTGGAATIQELGVTDTQLEKAIKTAHTLRARYTGLKYLNEKETGIKLG